MVGIIVTGHGKFATGLISSMELIAGAQENVIGVDFLEEDTTESLEKMIEEAINKLGDEVLVLSDLAGASPFRAAAGLSQKIKGKNIEVIAGTNLGMLLEVSLCRTGMCSLDLLRMAVDAGKSAIKIFKIKKREEAVEEIDGI
ncbi:PTS galactosamine/N-acetylgalactosamine transporter subunit IIA [Clostridium gasigenes]|uniref:PTS galactosamine/N-acetylgalactosamine transporter subunit IIA n=1 Tax=Clostridium gasigenes TaxID=94869 RepID=UPI001C0B9189|nr:PTS galactosamine/N-acetylgalactosamine transporter subunit IIA [Clostridium gasigenes]MBU3104724.1 PTS sugar transporter subunit IIA [Clostridium gasigenes]MBU3137914.1 PTS sugar transporter subunit IIA [Clostridium gasigenes]